MPRLIVGVAIMDAGRVVLAKQRWSEDWLLPGGIVDDGESVAQAAVRAAHEETGLELFPTYSPYCWRHQAPSFSS